MGRWKYHLDPSMIKSENEIVGIYCPKCKKVSIRVRSGPILELYKNGGKDTLDIRSTIECKRCNSSEIRVNIFKHLVRANKRLQPLPPYKGIQYITQW